MSFCQHVLKTDKHSRSHGTVVNLAHAGGEVTVLIVCVCVCVCVCYHSSGRYAYCKPPTKVPKESARRKDQFKRRN